MSALDQEAIIKEAIRDRQDQGIPLSCMTFALTDLNDEGLELYLSLGIELTKLHLMGSKVTDRGIALLDRVPNLEKLDISDTDVTTDSLSVWERKHALRSLTINSKSLREDGFAVIGRFSGLTRLTILHRYGDPFIHYDRGVGTPVNASDLQSLGQLTNMEELSLRGVPLQNDSLEWTGSMRRLRKVDLSNSHATAEALRNLASNQLLEELGLSNTDLNDETLEHLVDSLRITDLGIANTDVTDAAVIFLAARSPLKSVFAEDVKWSRPTCKALLNIPTLEWAELNIDGVPHDFLESVCPKRVWLHP